MAWSYHKRIKIIPGVHLNFSKSGISTSIGFNGSGMNFGKSGGKTAHFSEDAHPTLSAPLDNIFSAGIHEITSQNMQGIKEAMIMAHQQRKDLSEDLETVRKAVGQTKLKLNISYLLLYGFIIKSVADKIKADIRSQEDTITQINEQIIHSRVALDVQFEPELQEHYNLLVRRFRQLMNCHKIWDVTSAHYQDRVVARSSAGTLVSKREVRFGIHALPYLQSDLDVLYFQNANGADLYLYPGFIVMQATKGDFALIGIDELEFNYNSVRFTETGPVPGDSKIIDRTWAKVNKNGTPDKRFKGNYQIPVVRYGELSLKTTTGLHEEYECSNFEATEAFGQAFSTYQEGIRRLNRLS